MPMLPLREELALHAGPRLADGQPTWTLHDPVRNQFFRIDWQTFAILSHWQLDDLQAICHAVAAQTTLRPEPEDVEAVAEFLAANQLLQPRQADSARALAERLRQTRGSWARRLLHNYLFFRVPLVNPDRWLDRWSARVAPLYSGAFLRLTLAALVLGLILVYRNWGQFSTTLVDTISWQGLAAYGVALVVVKVLHELGHAFTAKRFGCRVPAMGVAFLVMWPVAYTDTNEVWKISDHRRRLAVAASGVATETFIAIWATLAWALLPEGGPKSIAFVLATVTWVTTLVINASPFLRFDGYFVLSDWLDMPNLHGRAFALARWHLREKLFDLGQPPPEHFSRQRTLGLILFAWATWFYRLVIFIGIAVLVYHFFIKLAGILLFAVELAWFIARPIWSEIRVWRELWPILKRKPRARRSAAWALGLALLFVVPWPTRVTASGFLKPQESLAVYAPAGAQVAELPWAEGAQVPEGAPLVKLASPDLSLRWQLATSRAQRLRQQAANAGLDASQQQNLQVLQQALAGAEAELASVQAEAGRYEPAAPFAGRLHDLDPDLKAGVWVRRQERLLTLVRPGKWVVETYLDEDAVRRVKAGDGGQFFAEGLGGGPLALTVTAVDPDATRLLPNGMLATAFGGSVLTREKDRQLVPERAVYRVALEADGGPDGLDGHSWRGHVVIRGSWEAPGLAFLRSALALLWREAGF
jgi:putative peptide zinc metalloprotease protein